jgi:hypothetical protein
LRVGLGVLLLVHVPAFLCLPPDNDVVLWDVCAREVLAGRALYRDVFENNLPGMLWAQAAVRALFGWRSEVIRAADLVVVGACVWLLTRWSPAGRAGIGLLLATFYLSTSEWCHAQRDVWMLLPALLAVALRCRQIEASFSFPRAFAEGLLWGAAFWVKPFVVVPALACWLTSLLLCRGRRWPVGSDAAGLLLGALAVGAAGVTGLARGGSWPDFRDVMLVWNREYAGHDYTEGRPDLVWAGLLVRFFPWMVVHLFAVPVALAWLARRRSPRRALLAAFYLGWLAQVVLLQHSWDYLHVPPLLLALAVLGVEAARSTPGKRRALATLLVLCVIVRLVPLTIDRLPTLPRCFRQGSTPAVRDRLSLLGRVRWRELEQVRDFLRRERVGDGEVSCLNMSTMSLLLDPELRPATRYLMLQNILVVFARQRPRVFAELADSRQRFLVVDVEWTVWKGNEPPAPEARVVFAAGPYRVYALSGKETERWARAHLELP